MNIYFCTTPKAGSQWFRDLNNNYLLQQYTRWRHQPHNGNELNVSADRWPAYDHDESLFVGPIYGIPPSFVARHTRPEDRVIGVFRDPRDVAISWMYSALYSHENMPKIDILRPVLAALPKTQRSFLSMYFGDQFCAFQGLWFESLPDNFMVTTYEQLLADTPVVLARVMQFLHAEVPDEVLRQVCKTYSFSTRSDGRRPGEEDIHSHYRKGISGDWRNYFTRELGRIVEHTRPGMLRKMGYEDSDQWWQALPEALPEEPLPAPSAQTQLELQQRIDALQNQLQASGQIVTQHAHTIQALRHTAEERLQLINELERTAVERLELAQRLEKIAEERLALIKPARWWRW